MKRCVVLSQPKMACLRGWVEVLTPLGALAHVRVESSDHELCEDWRILSSGRFYLLDKASFRHWFAAAMGTATPGLVAEVLLANEMQGEALELLRENPEARAHIQSLPTHCFDHDTSDKERLAHAVETARAVCSAEAAAMATLEAADDAEWIREALSRDPHLRHAVQRAWASSKNEQQALVARMAASLETGS